MLQALEEKKKISNKDIMYRYCTLLYYILCIYNMFFHFLTLTQVCVKELADYEGKKIMTHDVPALVTKMRDQF